MLRAFVGGEPGSERRDLEQNPAWLAEVDRAEVEAIDDRRDVGAGSREALPPRRVLGHLTRPGDVVDRARARHAAAGRWVVCVQSAAARPADLELPACD